MPSGLGNISAWVFTLIFKPKVMGYYGFCKYDLLKVLLVEATHVSLKL